MVTTAPHGLKTGYTTSFNGPFPAVTFTDGTLYTIQSPNPLYSFVTGANSFVVWMPGSSAAAVTLGSTVTLTAPYSQYYTRYQMPDPGIPYEAQAYTASQFSGCTLHVSVPMLASDTYVYSMARRLFANWPNVGQTVIVELGDEPWNWAQNQYNQCVFLGRIAGQSDYYWWYTHRAGQLRTIFRNVWGSRASEIKLGINCQFTNPSFDPLQQAIDTGCVVDLVMVAPYIDNPTDGNTLAAQSAATIEQCVDIWTHASI